jgi:signal peptidase II
MVSVLIAIAVIAIDLISKFLAVRYIKPIGSVSVIEGILDFTYVENRGMAFGALQDARWIFISVSLIMICIISLMIWKYHSKSKTFDLTLGLILGGGIGNMIDRIVLGYVVDFVDFCAFDFWKWVFNIADAAICVGTALLIVYLLFFDKIFNEKQEVRDE